MGTYRDLNDYEIMYMIEENDEAKELLFDKYRPIIINMARKYKKEGKMVGLEIEDLIQEGYLGLYSAIKNYNQDGSSIFYTYALVSIRSKILNALKLHNTQKKKILNSSISLSKSVSYDSDLSFIDFIVDEKAIIPDVVIEEKELFNFIREFVFSLDIENASIFELNLNGFNNNDISRLLDYSSKTVSNNLFRIRRKLQQYL